MLLSTITIFLFVTHYLWITKRQATLLWLTLEKLKNNNIICDAINRHFEILPSKLVIRKYKHIKPKYRPAWKQKSCKQESVKCFEHNKHSINCFVSCHHQKAVKNVFKWYWSNLRALWDMKCIVQLQADISVIVISVNICKLNFDKLRIAWGCFTIVSVSCIIYM